LSFDLLATDVQQSVIAHTGRTSGFASPTGKTAVEVIAQNRGGRLAFQHLLDLVDAAARTVQFITQ
jgi:hypothetical protein